MERVAIHTVLDVRAFVASTLNRSGIRFPEDEREELLAEGICIMVELGRAWDGRGKFDGYAAHYLPKRLADAWHKSHREHTYATTEDGSREWRYDQPPESLDQSARIDHPDWGGDGVVEFGIDPRGNLGAAGSIDPAELVGLLTPAGSYIGTPVHLALATVDLTPTTGASRMDGSDFGRNTRRALTESLADETDLHMRVSLMAASGAYTRAEIAQKLGLTMDDLRAIFGRLRRCAYLLDPTASPVASVMAA